MIRILPRSLWGQLALVMTAALAVATAINIGLVIAERNYVAFLEASGPPVVRFVDALSAVQSGQPAPGGPIRGGPAGPARGRIFVGPESAVERRHLPRHDRLEQRLREAISEAQLQVSDVRAAIRSRQPRSARLQPADTNGGFAPPRAAAPNLSDPSDGGGLRSVAAPPAEAGQASPPPQMQAEPPRREGAPTGFRARPGRDILLSAKLADGRWLNAVFFAPDPPPGALVQIAFSTAILFGCVLAAALWAASRLSRPLSRLAEAAARVGPTSGPQTLAETGPEEVRRTLAAFNAMTSRVSQLIEEKDVMLGALGHDLRTPLASLRIRLETMEPAAERDKAIATIEETTRLLEDILDLSRQGRSGEPVQPMDVALIVGDVVADYEDIGAAVALGGCARAPAACRPVLLKRALRNLIDNAVAYGGGACVSVANVPSRGAEIRIEDDGPGIPDERIAQTMRPFVRGEGSRSRTTGGAGLGLALASAIVHAHGGELRLANRSPRGLTASILLPPLLAQADGQSVEMQKKTAKAP